MHSRYSFGEIVEMIITLVICLSIIYRVALAYDIIPKDFQPFEIIKIEYNQLKYTLINKAKASDWFGETATKMLNAVDQAEKYVAEKQKAYKEFDQTAAKCEENSIFRFFMSIGLSSDEQKKCSENNLQIKNAVQDIDRSVGKKIPDTTQPVKSGTQSH